MGDPICDTQSRFRNLLHVKLPILVFVAICTIISQTYELKDQIGSRDGEKPRKPEEKTPPSPKEPKEEKSTANHLKTGHFPDVILCIITMLCDLQS
ncbi:2260_t:CDS:2 [Funneliformis caledonium]|uniref:2260_t:CDS:1 n=1 Tax=Funneliformis caledonium TaxID=1117310 RepID=A0A9N9DHU9_9GLOM|nr:2260_t:CDS:2 [Funneliformis caledonium]